jgi:hypothetical protein
MAVAMGYPALRDRPLRGLISLTKLPLRRLVSNFHFPVSIFGFPVLVSPFLISGLFFPQICLLFPLAAL